MTAHRERTLAHHTLRALRRCVDFAVKAGRSVRVQIILDSPDATTADFMAWAVGPQGYFEGLCDADIKQVSVRDPGLGRNVGVSMSRSPYVAVLDADNLPTANWLVEGLRALDETTGPTIVHPEVIVTFGERSELWPQRPSSHESFNVANMYELNYWDTVCIGHREVFERFPYDSTRDTGFGYEDWHFYSRTLSSGVPHISAPGTAYFYRIKPGDSVNAEHHTQGSVLRPTNLLVDTEVAQQVTAERTTAQPRRRKVRTPQTKAVLRSWRAKEAPVPLVQPDISLGRRLSQWLGQPVVPEHYKLLYPDLAAMTDRELQRHYRRIGRREQRQPRLRSADVAALAPGVFHPQHYRLLHGDLAQLNDAELVRHFVSHGRGERRQTLLREADLKALARLDVEDYRADNPDLVDMSDDDLVAHYLRFGRQEKRRPIIPSSERISEADRALNPALIEEWRALHELEPLIPIPTRGRVAQHRFIGPPADGSTTLASRVWWHVINALQGTRPQAIIFAPWLRMGGADILIARYAQTLADLRPEWEIVVITTHGTSTTQDWLPPNHRLIELPSIPGYDKLTDDQKGKLTVNLMVQLGPELVHVINSPEAFNGFEFSSRAITHTSRVYLTTFVIDRGPDGDIFSHLAKRRTGFLDDAEGVIVDNQALVEQLVELYLYPREKFHVHRQAVDLPERREPRTRAAGDPIKVLWAARFDRQKRLDILADVAEAAASSGLPIEWHIFGTAVMDSPEDTEKAIERLQRVGATFHGTYSAANPLDYSAYDAFMLTSESEGIPLTLLDVMAARLPVIASAVGGVPELIDKSTGFSVAEPSDIGAYLEALQVLVDSPSEGWTRADAAYRRLETDYSWEAFRRRVIETPGYLTPRTD